MGEGTPNLAFLVEKFSRPSTLINVFVSIDGHLLPPVQSHYRDTQFLPFGPRMGGYLHTIFVLEHTLMGCISPLQMVTPI